MMTHANKTMTGLSTEINQREACEEKKRNALLQGTSRPKQGHPDSL